MDEPARHAKPDFIARLKASGATSRSMWRHVFRTDPTQGGPASRHGAFWRSAALPGYLGAWSEKEKERTSLCALQRRGTEEQSRDPEPSEPAPSAHDATSVRSQSSDLSDTLRGTETCNPALDLNQDAKLTDKQLDCYSLVKEYQLPMGEVEQRIGTNVKLPTKSPASTRGSKRVLTVYRRTVPKPTSRHKRLDPDPRPDFERSRVVNLLETQSLARFPELMPRRGWLDPGSCARG